MNKISTGASTLDINIFHRQKMHSVQLRNRLHLLVKIFYLSNALHAAQNVRIECFKDLFFQQALNNRNASGEEKYINNNIDKKPFNNIVTQIRDDWSIFTKCKAYKVKKKRHENRQTDTIFLDPNDFEIGPSVKKDFSNEKKKKKIFKNQTIRSKSYIWTCIEGKKQNKDKYTNEFYNVLRWTLFKID